MNHPKHLSLFSTGATYTSSLCADFLFFKDKAEMTLFYFDKSPPKNKSSISNYLQS